MMDDIGWFIGMTLGDGSLSGRMVRVWNNDVTIVDKWKEILKNQFNISDASIKIRKLSKDRNGFKRNSDTTEATVNSSQFNNQIKELTKKLLETENKNLMCSILQGLFDAEGSINGRCEIVIWQRKDKQGNLVTEFIKKSLEFLDIKFRDESNSKFNILLILGGTRNKENFLKFSELIGFSNQNKNNWLELDKEILQSNKKITEEEVILFLKENGEVTINDFVKSFKVIETRIRKSLNQLVERRVVNKISTWPRKFSLTN